MPADVDTAAAIRDLTAVIADLRDTLPRDGYRVPAAARRIGVSEAHLRRLIDVGVIRTVPHMGDVVVIAQCEIDRVMGRAS